MLSAVAFVRVGVACLVAVLLTECVQLFGHVLIGLAQKRGHFKQEQTNDVL